MKMMKVAGAMILALPGAAAAQDAGGAETDAAELVKIVLEKRVAVDARPAVVWDRIGGPCDITDWLPSVTDCAAMETDEGVVRALNGDTIHELFTRVDNAGHSHDYVMTKGPLAAADYRSTLSVNAGEDGEGSIIAWSDEVSVPQAQVEAVQPIIEGILDAGIAGMRALFE
ncbi:MAG: SRPBCC family protein [Pacificimonas sp.]|jgi:hypothetical protein|nr:SRPBCC family protein [Pacificimonas sp.]